MVLARTRAEARALSWLMRERVLAHTPDAKRAVIEVSRDLDGRVTEPLEIAVGDRIRIGATQWEKQLFNGTVVTVEGIEMHPEVRRDDDTAVSRKARNRQAAGRWDAKASEAESSADESKAEPSVHITARTDDGRRVSFRHDEIRTGLVPPWRQPHPGTDILRSPEPLGIVDRGLEGQGHDRAYAGHGHQEAARLVFPGQLADQLLQASQLAAQIRPRAQDRFGRGFQHRVAGNQFPYPDLVAALRDLAQLQAEVAQHAAQRELHVDDRVLQRFTRGQQRPHLLRGHRLAVHRPEPAHLQKPRNALGVTAIRLDRHRLQRRLHLPGLHQHGLEAGVRQPLVQPLRQRAGFEPDRRDPLRQLTHEQDQRLGRAGDLRLRHDLTLLADNANRRACQGYIQSNIDFHRRCPFLPRNWGAPCGKTPRTRHACKGNDTRIAGIAASINGAGERHAPLRHLFRLLAGRLATSGP